MTVVETQNETREISPAEAKRLTTEFMDSVFYKRLLAPKIEERLDIAMSQAEATWEPVVALAWGKYRLALNTLKNDFYLWLNPSDLDDGGDESAPADNVAY